MRSWTMLLALDAATRSWHALPVIHFANRKRYDLTLCTLISRTPDMPIGKEDDAPGPIGVPMGKAREVLAVFLKLGLTSFGGPVAHLGYFHDEFVVRRRWFDERAYADLVALCQFLPGPASSQVGMAIGLSRAGYLGALAAWTAFTLPSAIALVLFAFSVGFLGQAL